MSTFDKTRIWQNRYHRAHVTRKPTIFLSGGRWLELEWEAVGHFSQWWLTDVDSGISAPDGSLDLSPEPR